MNFKSFLKLSVIVLSIFIALPTFAQDNPVLKKRNHKKINKQKQAELDKKYWRLFDIASSYMWVANSSEEYCKIKGKFIYFVSSRLAKSAEVEKHALKKGKVEHSSIGPDSIKSTVIPYSYVDRDSIWHELLKTLKEGANPKSQYIPSGLSYEEQSGLEKFKHWKNKRHFYTLLQVAAYENRPKVIKYLTKEKKYNVNYRFDETEQTALQLAAINASLEAVQALLALGANSELGGGHLDFDPNPVLELKVQKDGTFKAKKTKRTKMRRGELLRVYNYPKALESVYKMVNLLQKYEKSGKLRSRYGGYFGTEYFHFPDHWNRMDNYQKIINLLWKARKEKNKQ